ncbi:uncharacterized protein LOC129312564 [Prosopis cineraria]|uniref:uncharacterized protein LOC129312564 n=1 Tax=Prosopis cineraria TaxID=364024 RepID=UPI0024104364|nr:uncharacterized protein LOC129312564 [Prosopis cineraria]XP_054811196.1 uncharacterized protein LOC129312564 [Prosopis cineraria]XP_054811197.1 uncharacterized protein LOC129312564 [Prosopis cineraria]XP_054811198.1 uncharacterized protein LOC129312564 [Prosopis cineraria]
MRQVQEMAVEFVNALNAAAAAETECAKLRRLLEEERKLVQRLKQEKEDEAQMAKRKFERMSQRLAEAQKDVEYAATRADVAENEWVKLKRELREAQELVRLPRPESEETRQIVLRQVDNKEQELANALNAAAVAESECEKLRITLEEEQKLVQRLKLEKHDEAQLAKRQIEGIGQELADMRKNAEYATTRADVAENEWIKAKKELQEQRQLLQLPKPECDETRKSTMRQVEEKERELANALLASEIAERECARLTRMLEEEQKLVQRLRREKDDEMQLAKRQIEEIDEELARARKEAKLARKDADAAESEWTKVKRDLKNMQGHVKFLELQCQEIRESASRQDEEKALKLANALNASAIAERECARLARMLEEEQKLVQKLRLEKDDEVQVAKRQIEEIDQELAHAQKDAELARKDADAAESEWTKVKRDLKNMEEHVKLLELQCQEIRESASRQDEEKALKLANALNASAIAESECAKLKRMLIEEGKTVQRLIIEKDDEAELAKRQIEKIDQELANARKEAQHARKDADIAENEWAKVKRELKEKEELVKLLKLEITDIREGTIMQVQEISEELDAARKEAEHAQNDADIAQNEWIRAKKQLQEKLELVQLLKVECRETRESAMRQVEEKEQELADALNAATAASSSSAAARDCVICLTNEKDMAFGCGHMSCEECGKMLSMCPICREEITHRIKLFPG